MGPLTPALIEGGGQFLNAIGNWFGNSDKRKMDKLRLQWMPEVYNMLQSEVGKPTFSPETMQYLMGLFSKGIQPQLNKLSSSAARFGNASSPDAQRWIGNATIAPFANYQSDITQNAMQIDAQKQAEIRRLLAGIAGF